MFSIFSYVYGPSLCSSWRSVCSDPLPIFNWIVCLPGVELYEFFIYFGDQTLVEDIIDKYVAPYSQVPYHFDDDLFGCSNAF